MSYRTALFRSKGIPEWYIDIYKTLYVSHLGRHLKVLEGGAARGRQEWMGSYMTGIASMQYMVGLSSMTHLC